MDRRCHRCHQAQAPDCRGTPSRPAVDYLWRRADGLIPRIRIDDLSRTINDPLLLQVRKRLRREYAFPRNSRQKFKIDCVYTDEFPLFPQADGSVACAREPGADYRLL